MGVWVRGLGGLFGAWVGLGKVILVLHKVILRLGVMDFGVRVLVLGRQQLGFVT